MSEEDRSIFLSLTERLDRLYLRVMVLQTFLQQKGVQPEDIQARLHQFEAKWKERLERHLADASETLRQESLLDILQKFEGTKQQ